MTQSAAPAVPRNGFGVTALALALSGLASGLVPSTGFIPLILGMLAVLLGLRGWSYAHRGVATNRKMSMAGTVLGIGAATLGVWSIVVTSGAVDKFGKDLSGVGHNATAVSDVAVSDCSVTSAYGVPSVHATVKITNETGRTQSYLVTIGINDASGAPIGKVKTASSALGAGQSVSLSGAGAMGTVVRSARSGPAGCVVTNVTRFPSVMTCPVGEVDAKFC